MKAIIFIIGFCLVNILGYAQFPTNARDIPEPPDHRVKEYNSKIKAATPTLTARCFGTINPNGTVKSGSGNFHSFLLSGYYYIYIDSNLLKNSTIIMTANRAEYQCSYMIAQHKRFIFVAVHDISKNFTGNYEAEFNFAVFKR